MGWDMYDAIRPKLYNYWLPTASGYIPYTYTFEPEIPFFNWGAWSVWNRQYVAIRYINDSEQPITFKMMKLRILACNSGGQSFWAHNGIVPYTSGYGATYTIRTFVCNTPGAVNQDATTWHTLNFEQADPSSNVVSTSSFNMNYPGTSTSNTGMFGEPPYEFPMREFPINNCPEVLPGGFALFRLELTNPQRPANAEYRDPTIRFSMNPLEMEVEIEPKFNPYVWRAYHENGKVVWHLVRPVQVKANDGWHNIEGDDEN